MIAINLLGATACGKTSLAIALAETLPVSIINVDSALIYRGMDIGTAKPDCKLQEAIPHYLIDICDPSEAYSAADFAKDASKLIVEINQQGRIPLLVGGTMLYFKALYQGLSPLPSADPNIRAKIEADAALHGWDEIHKQLQSVDPIAAKRIHPNDPQRLQRALEVYMTTGIPLSDHWQQTQSLVPENLKTYTIALMPKTREQLREQIAIRFHQMLNTGFIDEVKTLFSRQDLHSDLPSMRAVGYRQVWQYLSGEIDHETMIEKSITATRQLAKRQMTWLRSWPDIDLTLDPFYDDIKTTALTGLQQWLGS